MIHSTLKQYTLGLKIHNHHHQLKRTRIVELLLEVLCTTKFPVKTGKRRATVKLRLCCNVDKIICWGHVNDCGDDDLIILS